MYSAQTASHLPLQGNTAAMALLVHELRSPLAAIRNAIAILRVSGEEASLQTRMHELIERQVRQISLLTSTVYTVSGPGVVSVPIDGARIDLCAVVRSAAETVAPELLDRKNDLLISLPESCVWVLGDSSRLEQVFINLLCNASKYSDVGGTVALSLQACGPSAVVRVRDNGVGLRADSIPFIFDLFARADSADVRMRSGCGIGLALVRSILDSHQGSVSASSPGVGQGSEFTVRLKIDQ